MITEDDRTCRRGEEAGGAGGFFFHLSVLHSASAGRSR